MQLKTIVGILPDKTLGSNEKFILDAAGADFYGNWGDDVGGVPGVCSTRGNEFYDNIYYTKWFIMESQKRLFNILKITKGKIPQTNEGMQMLVTQIINVCEIGKTCGIIGTGLEWQLPDKFGNPDLFEENIETMGYYVFANNINSLPYDVRRLRKASLIQAALAYSGAIHYASLTFLVQY